MSYKLIPGSRTEQFEPRPWAAMVAAMSRAYLGSGLSLPGGGPWDDEPDDVQWSDEATGYACWMKRGYSGQWNGYVCVPRSHPWWGWDYCDLDEDHDPLAAEFLVDSHWGLTFAGSWLAEGDWWFGFDCGHAYDLSPGMPAMPGSTYKDVGYVQRQCTLLALQLRARALIEEIQDGPSTDQSHHTGQPAAGGLLPGGHPLRRGLGDVADT